MAIQLFSPKFEIEECLEQIRDCMEKGWTGLGYKTIEFENEWKKYTGLPYAYYLNSATIGLNLAVEILKEENNWADGDEVITTPLTFVSTNHAILKAGLHAVFADVDDTFCLSPESVRKLITARTRAVLFVGMGGNTGCYEEIVSICRENGLKIILDAAHMAGTRLNGKVPGKEADVVVYSFQAVKNLPTADSGMICFANGNYDDIVRKKAWLGINKDTYTRTNNLGNYKWKYDVEYVGDKAHGNSIMASIGIVQLSYLDRDNSYRRQVAKWYDACLKCVADKIKFVRIPEDCESSRHLYQIVVEDRDGLMEHLHSAEIYPGVHYVSNCEYSMYSYAKGTCPNAEYISDHVLSLPMHLRLTYKDVRFISDKVIEFLNEK